MAQAVHRTDAVARPLAFRAYLLLTNVAGACVIGYAAARVIQDLNSGHLRGSGAAWLLGLLVVVGELRPVLARHEHDGSSTAVAFSLALLALCGWHAAAVAQAAAVVVCAVVNQHSWWRTTFNVTQYAVSLALGGVVFGLFFQQPLQIGDSLGWHRSLALVVAGAVYATANHSTMDCAMVGPTPSIAASSSAVAVETRSSERSSLAISRAALGPT